MFVLAILKFKNLIQSHHMTIDIYYEFHGSLSSALEWISKTTGFPISIQINYSIHSVCTLLYLWLEKKYEIF